MDIERFMQGYRAAWEGRDESLFCALFAADGEYHNTPFAVQRGHEQIRQYWQRTKLQKDIVLSFDILDAAPTRGIAHWHTTYQVTSEEMFAMWASSSGTNALARQPGDPLPRLALDGIALIELDDGGLCQHLRLWWHSVIDK